MKRILSFLFALILIFSLFSCTQDSVSLRVTVLAIGKADCIVLQTSGHVVMIDTGEEENYEEIASFLKTSGIETVDCLILSHFDKDHVGGAAKIVQNFQVLAAYQSAFSGDRPEYTAYISACEEKNVPVTRLGEKTDLSFDGVRFSLYPPEQDSYKKNEDNNSSVIVLCTASGKNLLFTGDALEERMEEFLGQNPGPCEFIKLPHHGSYLENYPEILEALSPEYAAITCSKKNPEDEALTALLSEKGVRYYLTRGGNPVSVKVSSSGMTVSQ